MAAEEAQLAWMQAAGFTLVDRSQRDETALYHGHGLHLHVSINIADPGMLMNDILDAAKRAALEDIRLRARKLASDLGMALKPI